MISDSGGWRGYFKQLFVLKNPTHEEYGQIKEWIDDYDENYDPEKFDIDAVKFNKFAKLICVQKKIGKEKK